MIKVIGGNNVQNFNVIVDEHTATPRSVLTDAGIDTATGMVSLNGATITDLDKTFDQYGVGDQCYLWSVAKLNNA